MTREIPLTQGRVTLVDDEDFGYLNQFKWFCAGSDKTIYAARTYHHRQERAMHRLIMRPDKWHIVHHRNKNGLDNRKKNLVILTMCEHKRFHSSWPTKETAHSRSQGGNNMKTKSIMVTLRYEELELLARLADTAYGSRSAVRQMAAVIIRQALDADELSRIRMEAAGAAETQE